MLPDMPRVTIEKLRSDFPKSGIDPIRFAVGVLDYARRLIPQEQIAPVGEKPTFHVWGVGALALAALANASSTEFQEPIKRIDDGYFAEVLPKVAGLTGGESLPEVERVWLGILQVFSLQPSLQGDSLAQFFRTLFLLELVDGEAQTLGPASPYDDLFKAAFGCSTLEYCGLFMGLFAASQQNVIIDLNRLFGRSPRTDALRALALGILRRQSSPYREVARKLDAEFPRHYAAGLVQAFFVKYPFVQLSESQYLLPPHPFLRLLAVSGPVFNALEQARARGESEGSPKPWTNRYSARMGVRFEALLRSMLEATYEPDSRYGEHEYLANRNDMSPDFVLFERDGTVVLIQAKLKRMKPGAFFGYDLNDFEDDAQGAFAEMIWKSVRYLCQLEAAAANNQLRPEHEALSRRVLGATRIVLVGVSAYLSPVFGLTMPREKVVGGVAKRLTETEMVGFRKIAAWHIVGFDDLVAFGSVGIGPHLGREVKAYVDNMAGPMATEAGIVVPSFRNWCIRKHLGNKAPIIPGNFSRAFDHLFKYGTKLIFGKDETAEP